MVPLSISIGKYIHPYISYLITCLAYRLLNTCFVCASVRVLLSRATNDSSTEIVSIFNKSIMR